MKAIAFGLLLVCVVAAISAQQQAERTARNDVMADEPHPYTISFFLFPHDQETNEPEKDAKAQLKNTTKHSDNVKDDTNHGKVTAALDNKDAKTQEPVPAHKTPGAPNHEGRVEKTSSVSKQKLETKPIDQKPKSPKTSDSDLKPKAVANKATIIPDEDEEDEDPDVSFQHGSVKHPAHEMYPHCHHCTKNSSYAECARKSTIKTCNQGLSNICYTRSVKRNNIVHYEMGCADHNTCTAARAKPCRASEKRCFTCCQWSGCNSQPHHGHGAHIAAYSSLLGGAAATSGTWTLVLALASFAHLLLTVLL